MKTLECEICGLSRKHRQYIGVEAVMDSPQLEEINNKTQPAITTDTTQEKMFVLCL